MIDHSQLDAMHDALRRAVMHSREIVIDDILTHHGVGVPPHPVGYLVTFHDADCPRVAYFTVGQLRSNSAPTWCMRMVA